MNKIMAKEITMKEKVYFGIGVIMVVAMFSLIGQFDSEYASLDNFNGTVKFYKSNSCGCCSLHASYLSKKGNLNVDVKTVKNMDSIKDEFNIPRELRTCHTFTVDGYYIEGHVPLEAINKLLEERPNIAGIALPEMPAGSPGMPGVKNGNWIIYGVNHDGSYFKWLVI